jgi:hypothetical protein
MKCKPLTQKEKDWIKRLQKTMDAIPPKLWLYVCQNITVMKEPENGNRFMPDGNDYDSENTVCTVMCRLGAVEGGEF